MIGVQPYRRTTAHAASSQAVGASGGRRRSYGDIGDIGGKRGRGAEAARGKTPGLQENFGHGYDRRLVGLNTTSEGRGSEEEEEEEGVKRRRRGGSEEG